MHVDLCGLAGGGNPGRALLLGTGLQCGASALRPHVDIKSDSGAQPCQLAYPDLLDGAVFDR